MSFLSSMKRHKHRPPTMPWERSPLPSQAPQATIVGDRRHLVGVPYLLPKDGPETSRLDFQHHFLHGVLQGHYTAPLSAATLKSVLDVGTGSGIWAREMARLFPQAHVTGFDLENLTSSAQVTPSNVQFVRGNVLHGLPFADNSFDFVHQRLLVAGIPATCWPTVVLDLARVTRPGGWVELVEAGDSSLNVGPAMTRFLKWGRTVSQQRGINASLMAQIGMMLRRAGLVEVQERTLPLPLGSWGGRAGELLATDTLSAFGSLQGVYCQALSLAPKQVREVLAALPEEWNAQHTVFQCFLAYGRKPQPREE